MRLGSRLASLRLRLPTPALPSSTDLHITTAPPHPSSSAPHLLLLHRGTYTTFRPTTATWTKPQGIKRGSCDGECGFNASTIPTGGLSISSLNSRTSSRKTDASYRRIATPRNGLPNSAQDAIMYSPIGARATTPRNHPAELVTRTKHEQINEESDLFGML